MPDETITTAKRSTVSHEGNDAPTIALRALVWVLADTLRSSRFLALTGLEPDDLRARISDPDLYAAVISFLSGHEPDLIACAEDIGVSPEAIRAAAQALRA